MALNCQSYCQESQDSFHRRARETLKDARQKYEQKFGKHGQNCSKEATLFGRIFVSSFALYVGNGAAIRVSMKQSENGSPRLTQKHVLLSVMFSWRMDPFLLDAAFLLTVGSFLLTVELCYLQLTILALLLTVGAFLLNKDLKGL